MRTRTALITAVLLGLAGLTLGLWATGTFNSSPSGNPVCTPAAAASFNAYWQQQISSAGYNNMDQALSAAETATAQRIKLCGNGG